jgi:dephospho-CoA kinase
MSFAVGLSGGIASGKSVAAQCFRDRKIPVIDADVLGKSLLEDSLDLQEKVIARFGSSCRMASGTLDRREIGRLVFKDPSALEAFNGILQPAMLDRLQTAMAQMTGLFCVDAALIYEWGVESQFDTVWVVAAGDDHRLKRLTGDRGLSAEEALQRLKVQLPQAEKCHRADRVFWNDGTVEELSGGVKTALDELMRKLSL